MCLDGDNAAHATAYINSQLVALHDIAAKCFEHYYAQDASAKVLTELPGYDFVLAAFYAKHTTASSSSSFHAFFEAPQLEIVCNHDAILHLHINEGELTVGSTNSKKGSGGGHHKSFNNRSISVRMPYTRYPLTGQADVIGKHPHTIDTLILDMEKCQIVDAKHLHNLEVGEDLKPFVNAYLKQFRKAGHHVLISLPSIDDVTVQRQMDFSAVTAHSYQHITEMHQVDIERINTYVKEAWRKAAWSVAEAEPSLHARKSIAVAEWRSEWSVANEETIHFKVKFGVPKVELLCAHEAVIRLKIDEVMFSKTNKFDDAQIHKGWEISLVVEVKFEVEEGGIVQLLVINPAKHGKYAESLSKLHGFDIGIQFNYDCFVRLIEFLSVEYIDLLDSGYFYLFRADSRLSITGGLGGSTDLWVGHTRSEDWSVDITTHTHMRGFQQIMALSQTSLDETFASYFASYGWMQKSASGADWNVTYNAIKIRLLSNNRALVFVPIKSGKLRTIRDGKPWAKGDTYDITDWELAFDVSIKLSDKVPTDPDVWQAKSCICAESKKFKHESKLKYLYLDFSDAVFQHDLCRFNDPNFGEGRPTIDKVTAARYYVREHYFHNLKTTGAQILYTVPLSKDTSALRPRYAWWDATFQIYSQSVVNHNNYNILRTDQEPVIVICGMLTPGSKLPPGGLFWSSNWLYGNVGTMGTVALSNEIFLNGRLLPVLEGINRVTTLLPKKLDMDAGNWIVELTNWSEKYSDPKYKDSRLASWEKQPSKSSSFEYKWDHTDEYEYKHEGRAEDHATGSNYLTLHTDNRLSIPTTFKSGQMDIVIRGKTTMAIGWKRETEDVRLGAKAEWTIVISAVTTAGGLKIIVTKEFEKKITDENVTGEFAVAERNSSLQPKHLLATAFPAEVQLKEQLKGLKSFESVWFAAFPGLGSYTLGNPFFTANGDLLMELCSLTATPRNTGALKSKHKTSTGPRPVISRPTPGTLTIPGGLRRRGGELSATSSSGGLTDRGSSSPSPRTGTTPLTPGEVLGGVLGVAGDDYKYHDTTAKARASFAANSIAAAPELPKVISFGEPADIAIVDGLEEELA